MTRRVKHIVLEKNEESRTGVCQECGPVPLTIKNGHWRCKIAVDIQRGDRSKYPRVRKEGSSSKFSKEVLAMRSKQLTDQGPLCKICKEVMERPCWDHCHETGRFRGYLCHKCNIGLGMFRDSPEFLKSAIHYLS